MNRRALVRGAAVAGGLATPYLAAAQTQVQWRSPGSFPRSTDVLWGVHEQICRRVGELTGGAFQIRAFAAGEIVPALQIFEAVGQGTVECGYTADYYYIGRDPSLGFGTVMPFGMNARQQYAWLTAGGGLEALQESHRDQGLVSLPCSNTGAQMGGWLRREVRSVDDLKGLKFRIAGLAGQVLAKVGVVPQVLGAADIYPALERGVVDGAEWVGPHDDEKLGLNRAAPFYYYPGWWEPCSQGDFVVNARAWDPLPRAYQQALEVATGETNAWSLARYDTANVLALRRLLASGTHLRAYPRDVLAACFKASQETFAELGDRDPRFRRVHQSWDRFRRDMQGWFRVAEDATANFLAVAERG